MTTNFKTLLQTQSANSLFDGKGDGDKDGKYYLAGGFDCFLAAAAEAIVADGIDRDTIAHLFVSHALEILNKASATYDPVAARANADRVLWHANELRKIYEDPEEIRNAI